MLENKEISIQKRKELSKTILSLRQKINEFEQQSTEVKKIDQAFANINLFISDKNTDKKTLNNLFIFLSKLDEAIKNPNETRMDDYVYYHSQAHCSSDLDD